MKIFHNEEIYIKTDNFSDSIFKENTMFFDIETTGFSQVKAIVYMIGCARRIKNRIVIDQYFAESVDDEAAVIEAFAGSLSGCSTIISFNGVGFDIPFLKNKYKKYKQEDPFCNVQILDIFKELSPIKPLLCLENYKQKSIEAFLGIDREDKYSGGELINVYYEYLAQKDDEKLSLLLTHNYEDVLGMTKLLSILSYKECIHGIADITGAYIAGIVLCTLEDAPYVERRVDISNYVLFAPIFFASIGLKTDISGLTPEILLFSVCFVVVALITKIIGCGLAAKICRFSWGDSLKVGVGMMTRGEVALIVAQKGLDIGVVDSVYITAVILLIVVSSVATPLVLKALFTKMPVQPHPSQAKQ